MTIAIARPAEAKASPAGVAARIANFVPKDTGFVGFVIKPAVEVVGQFEFALLLMP